MGFIIMSTLACLVMGAVVGLIATQGELAFYPRRILVAVIGVPCCCFGFVCGVLMGFKRVTNSMETRLIRDVSMTRSWFQLLMGGGVGSVIFYTLDPTTPVLKAKINL